MLRLPLALAAILAGALLVPAPAGAATRRPCLGDGGPRCHVWTGRVTFVQDGDSMEVDVAGDGTRRPTRIRLTGINAPELRRYSRDRSRRRGQCHGVAATNRLEHLVRQSRRRVRLMAQRRSSRSGVRLRRQVSVKLGGRWVDTGLIQVSERAVAARPPGDGLERPVPPRRGTVVRPAAR